MAATSRAAEPNCTAFSVLSGWQLPVCHPCTEPYAVKPGRLARAKRDLLNQVSRSVIGIFGACGTVPGTSGRVAKRVFKHVRQHLFYVG